MPILFGLKHGTDTSRQYLNAQRSLIRTLESYKRSYLSDYNSRVVNYDCRAFIWLVRGMFHLNESEIYIYFCWTFKLNSVIKFEHSFVIVFHRALFFFSFLFGYLLDRQKVLWIIIQVLANFNYRLDSGFGRQTFGLELN